MEQSNGPHQLHNLPSSTKIEWENYIQKNYLHFDKRINMERTKVMEDVKDYIENPDNITSHAFFPFIHFDIVFKKYVTIKTVKPDGEVEKKKERKKKSRKIYYSAHKDSFIYKYYGDLLNIAYNNYAKQKGIDEVALAYRNNKTGKNNIDFSFEVFEFLFRQEEALVVSIDFTSFFDNLSHNVLKQNIKTVLGTDKLPDAWYKVFKNLTQYSYINKTDIDAFLKRKYGVKKLKDIRLPKIMGSQDFRTFKRKHLKKNKETFGIPQGSGMSAVCSNVHLIHFDSEVLEWANQHNAIYRRYCDDLILVIPTIGLSNASIESIKEELFTIFSEYEPQGMKIQAQKTEVRIYRKKQILNESFEPSTLDYLGFVTDGQKMKLREKSLFNFYTRAYRKAKTSKRISYATKLPGPKKELYDLYTHLGYRYKGHGNFVSYALKAHEKMNTLRTQSLIRRQVKRHWEKIQKRLH